jgi:integrase
MTHSHKHSKSKNFWFRMDVPKRLQALAGTTSWKQSLGTSDPQVAAITRARLTAHYKGEVMRLDGMLATATTKNARDLVDRALEVLAAQKGSLDSIVRAILMFITLRARQSWGQSHRYDAAWDFGLAPYISEEDWQLDDEHYVEPFADFDSDQDRNNYIMRQRLLEHRGYADGITFQELAQRLLDQQGWSHVAFDLSCLLNVVGADLDEGTPEFAAAAEHLLRRLANHEFGDWQPQVREAIAPIAAQPGVATLPPVSYRSPPPEPQPPTLVGGGHPLSKVFADWRGYSKATPKTKDEFERGIRLFTAHFGDVPVETISKKMIVEWKRLLERLPAQAKKEVACLSPLEQAAQAEVNGLRTLSGQTATKYLQALRTTLKHARGEMLIIEGELATDGVSITIDENEKVDVQPFSEEQMALIFSQPVMTDPDAGDDETFWFLLSAPFSGCRMEETAQLRPTNIRAEKNIAFIAIELDRIAERRERAAAGDIKKRLKTKLTTKRNIPVHWILQEAGFVEFADLMKEREADWLFDDLNEYKKYDQRGKYMSNKIMRFLRRIGIEDRENVYHSFRHSLKRELRDDEQTKEEISDLLTGHSFSESVGRKYARGAGLKTLAAAVDRVSYDTVDWDKVVATGQARVARLKKRLAAAD